MVIQQITNWLASNLAAFETSDPVILYGMVMLGFCLVVLGFVANIAGLSTFVERKFSAAVQQRVGPSEIHIPIPFTDMKFRPFGVIQFIADGIKLISKEDIIPSDADRPLFKLAPFIVFAGSFPLWAVIPMGEGMYAANLNIGLLYLFAVAGVTVIGILLAGWASGNKWSLYGAMRSAAQIVSYELPSGIIFLTVVMALGSLNINTIIAEQSRNATPWLFTQLGLDLPGGMLNWFVFQYPPFTIIMFILFFVAGVAEVNRAPFDLPESESELVAGFHTEYTGMRFALFFLAEYTNMFVIGVITSILFLGGWQPPYPGYILPGVVGHSLEGFFWFTVKGYIFVILMMLMRWTLPRFRVDQLMHLAWKVMIPVSFINLAAIGLWISLVN